MPVHLNLMDLHVNVLAKQEQRKRHHDVHSHVGSFQMHQTVVVRNFPVGQLGARSTS